MDEMKYQPSLPRVIQLLSEKISRLEQENALFISQNENLIVLIQEQEATIKELTAALNKKKPEVKAE